MLLEIIEQDWFKLAAYEEEIRGVLARAITNWDRYIEDHCFKR